MKATVFDEKRGVFEVEIGELAHRLSTDSFFWLDIDGASAEELRTVARVLQIAEPASSWLPRFGQRPRFEVDGQQIRISTFAVEVSGTPIEAHVLYTRSWLLTVHAGAATTMQRARNTYRVLTDKSAFNRALGLLIVLSEFIGSFDPLLEQADELLGALEDQVLQAPKEAQLQQLSGLRKQLWSLHRLWQPQQDAIRNFVVAIGGLPEMSDKAQLFRDYEERISDLVDKINDLRQRAAEAMQSYTTSVANKQSQVINRLTIISAIFLPMTFLTGYFGMNLQWMVDHVQSLKAYLFLGVGLFVTMLVTTLLLFKRRGWL
jgi:Mg2+ and Co2+ transporter CorA